MSEAKNKQDIADILGEQVESEIVQEVNGQVEVIQQPETDPVVEDDMSDYFDDGVTVGNEAANEQAEALKLEGSFIGKNDLKEGNMIVVPLQYRFVPEFYSKEVLESLRSENPKAWMQTMLRMKSDVFSVVELHSAEFRREAVKEFNDATGDGVRNLFAKPNFMTWNGQNDVLAWLAEQDKNDDWYTANVSNVNRRPYNEHFGSFSRIKRIQQTSIPVIDTMGALRVIQVKLGSKNTFEKMISWNSFNDGAMEKDSSTEWFGKAVMVSASGSGYSFQIMESDKRITEAQRSRLERGSSASEQGFDFHNLFAFGESKKSPTRELMLDFMGIRELYDNR